jgi:H2-forming N5,N10-methylenetetrahydromethanopterin dehydrogenase-like enzyme
MRLYVPRADTVLEEMDDWLISTSKVGSAGVRVVRNDAKAVCPAVVAEVRNMFAKKS